VPRNGNALVDWPTIGPQVLAWLRETAPKRRTHIGLAAECADALGAPGLTRERLQGWLEHGQARAAWGAIKGTIGTGNGNGSHAAVASPPSPLSPGATPPSLAECIRLQRLGDERARCPVCQLSGELREQIAEAKRLGNTSTEILAALAKWHNTTILPPDYARHINRRHDP
jgi:hypothetical protein